jgi:hypothetical protein
VAAIAGCGGDDDSAAPPSETASSTTGTVTVRPPNLGCDVVAVCLPEVAHELLERCPAGRLSPDGRHARKRLEKVLDQIEEVDLHNKQAYEASDAAVDALTQLERACR